MLGGKKARDARIHGGYGGGLDSRERKDKSSWTQYEWLNEVASCFNDNNWCFYCDFYASVGYDTISIEASVDPCSSVPDSSVAQEARNILQKAIDATGCPYKVTMELQIYR